jgi:hypothetical protein
MRSPKKSRNCVLAIRMAMPFVKPTTTGRGMNRTADPMPVAPSAMRMMPAIIVQISSRRSRTFVAIPATMTTNAPVGPPIWTRDPPSALISAPATIAV